MTEQSRLRSNVAYALLFLAAAPLTWWVLRRQFSGTEANAVVAAVHAQPPLRILMAVALTALSFAALASFDWLGVAIVAPGRVTPATALLAGATANAVSNTLGFHVLTGSAVRAHIYLRHGLSASEAARVVSLSWLALGLGFASMLALAYVIEPGSSPLIGGAIGLGLLAFVAWLGRRPREVRALRWRQPLPTARLALVQMLIGGVESACAIGALYVLLPADLAPPFSHFAVGCIAAVAAGLVVHAPGGLGVFEAAITALLSGAGRTDLLAALLLYRAIYNLLPFLLSVIVLGALAFTGGPAVSSSADSA